MSTTTNPAYLEIACAAATGEPARIGDLREELRAITAALDAERALAARLAERARQEQAEKVAAIRGEQTEAGWGRQIRSYVMQPYQMVKDLRTEFEVGNIQGVLDGDIDGLIDSYLHWRRSGRSDA